MWDACRMPWVPELFSAPLVAQLQEKWQRDRLEAVPYFDGLTAGEPDALVESFAGEPVLHDPVRGRITGVRAFQAFVTEMNAWLAQRIDRGPPPRHRRATRLRGGGSPPPR